MTPHIALVPVGPIEGAFLAEVRYRVALRFPWPVHVRAGFDDIDDAWSPDRGQHFSTRLLRRLAEDGPADARRVLAIGELDLFLPVLTFVFGEAQLGGRCAVLGLTRLRQEFYGLPPDLDRLRDRAVKEAVHELGHTFSLVHCRIPTCVMASSPSAEDIDLKDDGFCPACAARLRDAVVDDLNGWRRGFQRST